MSAQLRLAEPRSENRSVPVRPANAELRSREYLTEAEVEKLMKQARQGRYGHRDATLMLIAFRHGLRAIEICDFEWSQVEFGRSASLHVRRVKNGKPSVHPLCGDEIRSLRELRRQFPDSGFVFATERGGPFTSDAVNRLIKRIGERARMPFPRFMPTCFAMAAAMRWPMRDTIRERSRTGSVTARSSTPCAIPSWRPRGSRISGADGADGSQRPQRAAGCEKPRFTAPRLMLFPFRH
jgi:integrase